MSTPANLTILRDGALVKSVDIEGQVVLGRSKDCEICLNDQAISRQHAVFRLTSEGVQVERKSEFAPLFVNGAECSSAILKDGDLVSFGPYMGRISVGKIAAAAIATTTPSANVDVNANVDINANETDLQSSHETLQPAEWSGIASEESSDGSLNQENSLDLNFKMESPNESLEQNQNEDNLSEAVEEDLGPIDDDGKTKISVRTKVTAKLSFPGPSNLKDYQIKKEEITLGRGKDCDVVLNDKKASRQHAVIKKVGVQYLIQDMNSANGTYVNGQKVSENQLSDGDEVRIGNINFKFHAVIEDFENQQKDFMSLPTLEEDDVPLSVSVNPDGAHVFHDPISTAEIQQPQPEASGLGAVANAQQLGNIPGITGITGADSKKKTLMERFRALPKRTQVIATIAIILFLSWLNEEDEVPVVKKNTKKVVAKASPGPMSDKGSATFDGLTEDKKKFVEAQHQLAFDYYKNKEYDKALFEIEKIFTIIPDYKDSREIQRYAKEGKRKMEAIEEERRKKEEEAQLKAKIEQLVEETRIKMKAKKYEEARELFVQIVSIDPDNAAITEWKKEIEDFEEQQRQKIQQEQLRKEVNQHAWHMYREGLALKKKGKFHSAITIFESVITIGATDQRLIPLSRKMIAQAKSKINALREPVLSEAKQLEESGELSKAFKLYQKATRIDPPHPTGYAGMNRIRGILHDRAKTKYMEGILAESYSDFSNAKKFFEECIEIAPTDDIYHERAKRKLSHYFDKNSEGSIQ